MKMHISREKLKKRILEDPDIDICCGVGESGRPRRSHKPKIVGSNPSSAIMKQQYVLKPNSDPLLAGKRKFWDLIYKEGKGYSPQTVWTFSEKSLIALRDEIEKVLKRKQ